MNGGRLTSPRSTHTSAKRREAVRGVNEQGHQGRNEGAHALSGRHQILAASERVVFGLSIFQAFRFATIPSKAFTLVNPIKDHLARPFAEALDIVRWSIGTSLFKKAQTPWSFVENFSQHACALKHRSCTRQTPSSARTDACAELSIVSPRRTSSRNAASFRKWMQRKQEGLWLP